MSSFRRAFALPIVVASAFAAQPGAVPLSKLSGPAGPAMFTRLADKTVTGIDFVSPVDLQHPKNFLYHSGTATGGVAIGDVDGDGRPDIFVVGGPGGNKLFRQIGDLKFEDITARVSGGLDGGDAWGGGVAMIDVNGDGRLDIYVCNYDAPNQLFINSGKAGAPLAFVESAKDCGLDLVDASHSAGFADYDGDGDMDMYLLTNRYDDPAGFNPLMPVETKDGVPVLKVGAEKYYSMWRMDENNWGTEPSGTPDRLMRNDGGKFTDVSRAAGIHGRGDGLSASWFDYDNDGDLDLWVANDFLSEDRLYRNNGDGTFTNVLPDAVSHTCWFSMGADFGDFNNDGWLDLFVADMAATTNLKSKITGNMTPIEFRRASLARPAQVSHNGLFLNTGTGHFAEIAQVCGIAATDWSWSVKVADFDCDGWQDIYVNNGVVRMMNDADMKVPQDALVGKRLWDFYKEGESRKERHHAFRNGGALVFTPFGREWGLDHEGVSYGCAYADLDRDGDIDLVEVGLEENVAIYRNDNSKCQRVAFVLRGASGNSQAIGARVTIKTKSGSQTRLLSPTTGYQSHNEALLHFGLGEDSIVDECIVRWPRGAEERFEKLVAGKLYTFVEPAKSSAARVTNVPAAPMFIASDALAGSKHEDAPFDDFSKQGLLPRGLSQSGPGIAWGDVDGDGDYDYYLGKGAGQIGEVRFNDGKGRFIARFSPAFRADKAAEDAVPLFFDADGDGDLDLFVAGGSYQFAPGDAEQRDRLYLGDGKGAFEKADGRLPKNDMPAGAACAADFDRDGDVDVFVGERVVAEDYPAPANGRLLRNDGKGKFTDATKDLAPELPNSGLITSALWTDANNDGWLDLLVAHEWGSVKLFLNRDGKLTLARGTGDLEKKHGWWSALAAADVNHDGRMDYLAVNLGWNTRYGRPTEARPARLFYGAFLDSGLPKIVEAIYEGDVLLPRRGLNASILDMPDLRQKFRTHRAFGTATLEQIYGAKALDDSMKLDVNEAASGVFIAAGTDSAPSYTFQALPLPAQFAAGFGCIFSDLDGDGHADIFIAQNSRGGPAELPKFDGGTGALLLGDGKGGFTPVAPRRSGIVELGDGRATTLADLNGDDWPDIALGVNNAAMRAFSNHPVPGRAMLRVEFPPGQAGTRVTVEAPGLPPQTAELALGGGHASQGAPVLWFGLTVKITGSLIKIRWPDGKTAEQPITGTHLKLVPQK